MKANPPPRGPALLHQTPAGSIVIVENGTAVTHVFFGRLMQPEHVEWKKTPLLRRTFDVPLSPQGTEFEQTVWKALQTIPHGETRSYGDIARQIGHPSACQAVGHANNQNPIGIIIPCHRVIGANGKLTGYAGGMTIKQYLLELEQGAMAPFMLFPDTVGHPRRFLIPA